MPVQPTYPGVYVQEVPSGVRTIVGVSTSVTAFVGTALRGPINRAVTIFNFSEFETIYGGLSADSEMSYGVRQFFNNGGSQAIITRIADGAVAATATLAALDTGVVANSLEITALDAGSDGNNIQVSVDYNTSAPDSTFNLTFTYTNPDNPGDIRTETFSNLSMNSESFQYVLDMVNGTSELATVAIDPAITPALLGGLGPGTATGATMADVNATLTSLDATHNTFRVAVDGGDPFTVVVPLPVPGAGPTQLLDFCNSLPTSGFTVAPNADGDAIVFTSATTGENSRVDILPGLTNDAATRLGLTVGTGGSQTDAVASIRPAETPDPATLTSGEIAAADLGADGAINISLDGSVPLPIDIITSDLLAPLHEDNVTALAQRIQDAVQGLKPNVLAYREFTVTVDTSGANPVLVMATGSRGAGASIVITEAGGGTLAASLNLLVGIGASPATTTLPVDNTLTGGTEGPITPANAYTNYIGSRANREGIYALEAVDIFNILVLPGVFDPGILADAVAYCQERRAFMIVDTDPLIDTPAEMATEISGTAFPNSDYGAVYFPYLRIADPLRGGRLRTTAPSGTMAGLYARTDANRGVWKAPAGTEANLVGVQGMSYTLTDPENGQLNPLGANCLRIFPVYGAISWGARTLNGADQIASEYKYIPVRRLALFIEESLFRGLKWAVFEPNDERLWAQIRLNVGAFMQNLFRQGAFQGTKRDEAYFVKCDSETTTQNDINLGVVNIRVGFAPLKPAEFVVLYLQQIAGQIEV